MIHQQTEDTFKKKIKLWKCLSDFIKVYNNIYARISKHEVVEIKNVGGTKQLL